MAKLSTAAIQGFSTPYPWTSSGSASGRATPRKILCTIAEVALHVPDEGDLAAIEVGQVDAGAENALAAIFRVIDLAAAHDGDFGRRIEDREVDRDLHLVERRLDPRR